MSGRLLVVGTPIGNLGDLTPRAADALRTADLLVAEDTRVLARLLAHLAVRRPTLSFNEHNAASRLPGLLARLATGETVALTTDAGMPGVSDPGAALVAAARAAGALVEVVPGASAVTAAVALSGVDAAGFVFGGFLPARPASVRAMALERLLIAAGSTSLPLVVFESPHRVRKLLATLAERVPDAQVAVCRELTKHHEEVTVGTPAEEAERLTEERGEFVLVISGLRDGPATSSEGAVDGARIAASALAAGIGERSIVELLRSLGMGRREAYLLVRAAQPSQR